MKPRAHIIWDFDLTIFNHESTLCLARKAAMGDERLEAFLRAHDVKDKRINIRISNVRNMLSIIRKIRKSTIVTCVEEISDQIDPVFRDVIREFVDLGVKSHVISAGYQEIISPLMNDLGIPDADIAANRFIWMGDRVLCMAPSVLHGARGKVAVVRRWKASGKLNGPVIMIGDGQPDRNVYLHGAADGFIQADYYRSCPDHGLTGNYLASCAPADLKQQISDVLQTATGRQF